MDQSLVKWNCWYEMFPGGSCRCIVINRMFFFNKARILCDDGSVITVRSENIIPYGEQLI